MNPQDSPQRPLALVAMASVTHVAKSILFYQQLGFLIDHQHCNTDGDVVWVHLQSANAHLMLSQNSRPPCPPEGVLIYLYYQDVRQLHDQLLSAGLAVEDLCFPFYRPLGQFRVLDPDGHQIICTHL